MRDGKQYNVSLYHMIWLFVLGLPSIRKKNGRQERVYSLRSAAGISEDRLRRGCFHARAARSATSHPQSIHAWRSGRRLLPSVDTPQARTTEERFGRRRQGRATIRCHFLSHHLWSASLQRETAAPCRARFLQGESANRYQHVQCGSGWRFPLGQRISWPPVTLIAWPVI